MAPAVKDGVNKPPGAPLRTAASARNANWGNKERPEPRSTAHWWACCAPPKRRAGRDLVEDLQAALLARHLAGPYILVGHSLGGLYVRRSAAQFPGEVAGLDSGGQFR